MLNNPLALSDSERREKVHRANLLRTGSGTILTFASLFFGTWLVGSHPIGTSLLVAGAAGVVVGGAHFAIRQVIPPRITEPQFVELTDEDDEPIQWDASTIFITIFIVAPLMLCLLVVQFWIPALIIAVFWAVEGGGFLMPLLALAGAVAVVALWELLALHPLARRWGLADDV